MKKKSLIIFTRYPEVGKTKTRLIPALGAEKSADLQRLMTENTLKKLDNLTNTIDLEINIYFSGGNIDLMKKWLGNKYSFYPQIEGDLGFKIYSAFEDNLKRGKEQIIIIGVDCPDLDSQILQEAFLSLNNYDLVIGKAMDGGYYLLGLNMLEKILFTNINWGTSQVFSQTMSIAKKLNFTIHELPILRDIDRPEDLKYIGVSFTKEIIKP
ncbi:TIGR04282 family arsenosugar biosynthesis glycosyltransferase [Geminocystis sp. NIES-3709]|uniref:TIGR04282 family arsenosugar biosynthesis glycosyltransferase n=1 Tax=Geminocystis sp. NIES-3709 TaxID=1617448 RepID=UPI0005FCD6E8|nr:TIGR04282 family arsenosugar biosynthesis glycosyltransferase [Geminocystis sp. NIES-3709]BAQ63476.1 glycosyltransferase [Geminocystis sp. NIES-3709]